MKTLATLLLGAALLLPLPLHAEQFVRAGDYIVHYSALNTLDLTPEVTRQFGITRSGQRALLVLNAQRVSGEHTTPVAATATARSRNLLGQVDEIEMRPAQEGEVHYVLGSFPVIDGEYLTIEAEVVIDGAAAPVKLKFRQQFYRE